MNYKPFTEPSLDSRGPFCDVIVLMLATTAAQDLIKLFGLSICNGAWPRNRRLAMDFLKFARQSTSHLAQVVGLPNGEVYSGYLPSANVPGRWPTQQVATPPTRRCAHTHERGPRSCAGWMWS